MAAREQFARSKYYVRNGAACLTRQGRKKILVLLIPGGLGWLAPLALWLAWLLGWL